jgi:hypothetical protein
MSLESLRAGSPVEFIFRVPDSAQWTRIRKERTMGDNGYVVLAATKRNDKLIPFSTLNLEVAITGRTGPVSQRAADYSPYGYSSDTRDVGLRFQAPPRDELRVRLIARRPESLPNGELIIEPYWDWSAKDFGVGASVDADYLRPFVIRTTQLALVLLVTAVAVSLRERLRGSKSSPS